MSGQTLLRISALLAILGGLLRIAAVFIPWSPDSPPLEALYLAIDLALLFGLMGVYLAHHRRLGVPGLAGFAIASAGLVLIARPDQVKFGFDSYYMGVLIIAIGLALLSLDLLYRRAMVLAPGCWLASIAAGAAGAASGYSKEGLVAAGVLFGLGFVSAGLAVVNAVGGQARPPESG